MRGRRRNGRGARPRGIHGPRLATLSAAAVAAVLALGACGLPDSGPVQQGLEVGAAPLPPVRFQFEAPRTGARPEEIVRGFLAASWSGQDDYLAARAYLTAGASAGWDPRSSVTVYSSSAQLHLEVPSEGRVRLRAAEIASVDGSGRYASRPFGSTRRSVVELSRASGQWRISRLDADFGVWLSRPYFESAYRPFQIAYVGAHDRTVVADRRWFPVATGLATALARALVEPVPDYLRGAVVSGFPPSGELALDAVPVLDEQARIDLDPAVLGGSAAQRRAAWAQALVTMRQVPGVSSVSLQVQGRELDLGVASGRPSSPDALGVSTSVATSPYVVRRQGDRLLVADRDGVRDGDTAARAGTRRLPEVPPGWVRIAVRPDVAEVAAIGGDGLDLARWRGGGSVPVRRFAAALTPPAFDGHDVLWVAGSDRAGRSTLYVLPPGSSSAPGASASPRAVGTPWLGRDRLLEVRPAPDGSRAVVLSRDPSGRVRIGVSGVVRDSGGLPLALTAPWRVGGDVVDATRVAWVNPGMLAVLGRRDAGGTVRPLLVSVGGPTTALSPVSDPRSIVSAGGERGLVVVSGDGRAFARAGAGWQSIGRADDLVVPGG